MKKLFICLFILAFFSFPCFAISLDDIESVDDLYYYSADHFPVAPSMASPYDNFIIMHDDVRLPGYCVLFYNGAVGTMSRGTSYVGHLFSTVFSDDYMTQVYYSSDFVFQSSSNVKNSQVFEFLNTETNQYESIVVYSSNSYSNVIYGVNTVVLPKLNPHLWTPARVGQSIHQVMRILTDRISPEVRVLMMTGIAILSLMVLLPVLIQFFLIFFLI